MQTNEFTIFRNLLNDVYAKAFGESLDYLSHGKAQALSWFIEETTGQLLSYKTLINYANAVLEIAPGRINPNLTTLAILVRFVQGHLSGSDVALWYQYRGTVLRREGSICLAAQERAA